ncbi:hypothetical protein NIES4071_33370 [Calothrix sp. NIES-4071]|nr:hypothetical protein NIES4071_33370 [Calothrix sp. NIES-4071]BAZ57656.1 hypothetical protein NIES4105_33300 [Calothrix sp. NIES-4105]
MKGVSNKLISVVILKCLLRAYALACKVLVVLTVISFLPRAIASEQKSDTSIEAQPLQTEITQRDFKIIEQLVTIALRNSALVQETRVAMGPSRISRHSVCRVGAISNDNNFCVTRYFICKRAQFFSYHHGRPN